VEELKHLIRTVPDFPKKGIGFKDITTLIKDGSAFRLAIEQMSEPFQQQPPDLVAGVEARGFLFAAAMAHRWGVGVIPVRKPGKLPAEKLREEYQLEYGIDAVEIHKDAIQPGQRVLLVDDLLATGGTCSATARLVERLGGKVIGLSFLIELSFLHGREKLQGYPVHSVIQFDSE